MVIKVQHNGEVFKPFDEINCPLCDSSEFITLYHSSVWCIGCNAEFKAMPLGSDPGYTVEVKTNNVWKDDVKYPELLEAKIYCFRAEEKPEWLIYSEHVEWPQKRDLYLEKIRELINKATNRKGVEIHESSS